MMRRTAVLICALAAFPVAGAPVLEVPIDCTLGDSCYIQNYVDSDPSKEWSDFTCGPLTYDGHKGTDFALPTVHAMTQGVAIMAAADGVVTGTRDGMKDVAVTKETKASVKGRECGNGVAIDHGNGWTAQYCHMKQNSISVEAGQSVQAGDTLGQVGLSGNTQFPHLHFSLRHNGLIVDPFAPNGPENSCSVTAETTLWKNAPTYLAGGILRLGFDKKIPAYADVKSGVSGIVSLPNDAPALVLFVHGFGRRTGDEVTFEITGPNEFFFNHTTTFDAAKAMYMQAAGKKRRAEHWAVGQYRGVVSLSRDGEIHDQSELELTVK